MAYHSLVTVRPHGPGPSRNTQRSVWWVIRLRPLHGFGMVAKKRIVLIAFSWNCWVFLLFIFVFLLLNGLFEGLWGHAVGDCCLIFLI